jgi:hypothetical protein
MAVFGDLGTFGQIDEWIIVLLGAFDLVSVLFTGNSRSARRGGGGGDGSLWLGSGLERFEGFDVL